MINIYTSSNIFVGFRPAMFAMSILARFPCLPFIRNQACSIKRSRRSHCPVPHLAERHRTVRVRASSAATRVIGVRCVHDAGGEGGRVVMAAVKRLQANR